jgi:hypothetical protein
MGPDCAIPLQKTHSIVFEPRQLCYPWHPWYGRSVLTRKAGGAHADVAYFCKLPEAPLHAMLVEVPKWMFDAAHCATMRVAEVPHVDCATLRILESTIAEQCVSVKAVVLQPQVSRHTGHGGSDDNNFGRTSKDAADAVQRTLRRTVLEQSRRVNARRGSQTSGEAATQRSHEQPRKRSSEPRSTQ